MRNDGMKTSVPGKVRDSNMELLRIVAMILVMVVHANFRALPVPGVVQVTAHPASAMLQFLTEGLSIIAVNVFVLLSGWYGIKPKMNRFVELLFQILFFTVVGVGLASVFAPSGLQPDFWKRFFMLGDGQYWFVKTYIGLYIFAPVLNAFVKHATKREFSTFLIVFFVFQSIFGWMWEATTWFKAGYSLTSFMGLYLLARYIRLYPSRCWTMNRWADMTIYLVIALLLTVAMFYIKKNAGLGGMLYYYNCPLVIISAVHFMLFFSKLSFRSRIVNWVAISAFAVYLTHSSTFLWKLYDNAIVQWFNNVESTIVFVIYVVVMMFAVFWASILLDKVRLLLWNMTNNLINNIKPNKI